jgi:hypothetical protein
MATRGGKIHQMLADFHKSASEANGKCAESMEKGAGREFHETMAAIHAQHHDAHASECEEANKVATPEVSKVAPTIPANIRPVPRNGQQFDKATIPAEFARFVTTVAEEE